MDYYRIPYITLPQHYIQHNSIVLSNMCWKSIDQPSFWPIFHRLSLDHAACHAHAFHTLFYHRVNFLHAVEPRSQAVNA